MSSRHKQPNRIRQLRVGDAIPPGEPKRYRSQRGYIRLRWKVGVYCYVEVYEHRIVAGLVSKQVHHKNEQKDDNAKDNLAPVSSLDHGAAHSRVDLREAIDLYRAGWSLPRLAARYAVCHVSIMRSLKRRGVLIRTLTESRRLRATEQLRRKG